MQKFNSERVQEVVTAHSGMWSSANHVLLKINQAIRVHRYSEMLNNELTISDVLFSTSDGKATFMFPISLLQAEDDEITRWAEDYQIDKYQRILLKNQKQIDFLIDFNMSIAKKLEELSQPA